MEKRKLTKNQSNIKINHHKKSQLIPIDQTSELIRDVAVSIKDTLDQPRRVHAIPLIENTSGILYACSVLADIKRL